MATQSKIGRRQFLRGLAGTAVATGAFGGETPVAIDERRRQLARWIGKSFVAGEINLVPNLPTGKIRSGRTRDDLKNLYWLQNCNLFAMHALRPFDAELAEKIKQSYHRWYRTAFPDVAEQTEHYLVLGKLPKVEVPEGKYLRTIVKLKQRDGYRVGTETFDRSQLGNIRRDDPRTLLKFGVLRARLAGNRKLAGEYFASAMKLFDGVGFRERRQEGAYHTRCLAYALLAERALATKIAADVRGQIEGRLWACQDTDGGIWTDYLADGSIPGRAKKTNEIAPLTLLAYDRAFWS